MSKPCERIHEIRDVLHTHTYIHTHVDLHTCLLEPSSCKPLVCQGMGRPMHAQMYLAGKRVCVCVCNVPVRCTAGTLWLLRARVRLRYRTCTAAVQHSTHTYTYTQTPCQCKSLPVADCTTECVMARTTKRVRVVYNQVSDAGVPTLRGRVFACVIECKPWVRDYPHKHCVCVFVCVCVCALSTHVYALQCLATLVLVTLHQRTLARYRKPLDTRFRIHHQVTPSLGVLSHTYHTRSHKVTHTSHDTQTNWKLSVQRACVCVCVCARLDTCANMQTPPQ